jgi:hypothetical protein
VKFYADSRSRLARRLAVDLLVLVWTVLAVVLGLVVHAQILRLQAVGTAISVTGQTFNSWIGDFGSSVPGQSLPIIGSTLSDYLNQLTGSLKVHSGDLLISHGNEANNLIAALAGYAAVATVVVAILLVTVPYLGFRIAGAREMGASQAFVESARAGGRTREAESLLAFRALATLRFTRIMQVSADPVGDLTTGNRAGLASAMMTRMGLDTKRLYGDTPLPIPSSSGRRT